MKHMKKTLCLGLTLCLSLGLLAACSGGTPPPAATPAIPATPPTNALAFTTAESGKLHMATNAAFPPYEMLKDNGGFEGIDVEVAGLIAKKLGLELVVDDMDFNAALAAAQTGRSDIVMAGVTVTDERKQNMDFTDSYATGIQVVIVPQGSSITSLDGLTGKMIGTQEGTTGYIYCSDAPENGGYGEDHVVAYTNGATAVEALKGGKVDCVVIDNEPAKAFVAANPGLQILEAEFAVEDYAIGLAKGNTGLLDAVNGALKELVADGSVQAVIDTYIKAE